MQINLNTNTILHNLEVNLNKIADPSKIDETNSTDKTIDDSFRSDINSKKAELMSYNDAIGYMQIADGALQGVSQQTQILNKLDVATHNDTLNSQQKSMLHHQMDEIKKGISKTLESTTYNGVNVFNNSFQVGNNVSVSLHVDSKRLDVTDSDSIQEFQKFIDKTRSDISAFNLDATSKVDELSNKIINESYSKSQLEPDIAENINSVKKDDLELNASTIASTHNMDLLAQQIKTLLG